MPIRSIRSQKSASWIEDLRDLHAKLRLILRQATALGARQVGAAWAHWISERGNNLVVPCPFLEKAVRNLGEVGVRRTYFTFTVLFLVRVLERRRTRLRLIFHPSQRLEGMPCLLS